MSNILYIFYISYIFNYTYSRFAPPDAFILSMSFLYPFSIIQNFPYFFKKKIEVSQNLRTKKNKLILQFKLETYQNALKIF